MRTRMVKKNIFLKKSTWLLIVVFVATLITIPTFTTTKAATRNVDYTDVDVIKVLDIEPGGNSFTLGNGTDRVINQQVSNENVQITRISMAEFISMIDEIKGKYDIVVIGRSNGVLEKKFEYNKQYRDYSAPFYQEFSDNLLYTGADNPLKNTHPSGYTYPIDGIDKGKKFIEYYSENDITKKRAEEIENMIKSGAPVYFANEIFQDAELTASKLSSIFSPYSSTTYPNLHKISQATFNITDIVNSYISLDSKVKRPKVSKLEMSLDDRDLENASIGNRTMTFTLTVADNEELKPSLYLDINADGIFTEREMAKINVEHTGNKYKITSTMDSTFVGYLDWKIELTRDNTVKTYVINNSIFKAIGKLKRIKALQIHPITSSDGSNLYLNGGNGTDAQNKFNDVIRGLDLPKLGYDLTIDAISCDKFNKTSEKDKLLENYDMIIVGFADSYGDNQFNQDATNSLETFAKLGKSALYTHDTMTLNTFGGNGIDNTWYMSCGPKLLGQRLRDYFGQARYVDNYRRGDNKDLDGDTIIPHDPLIPPLSKGSEKTDYATSLNAGQLYSMGATLYMNNNRWQSTKTIKVRSVNNAQISSYPFVLPDTMEVTGTHTQWFQLNLEAKDIVPWYNLMPQGSDDKGKYWDDNKFDSGDSRNFYYTYSKGNITYSGTGHTSTDYAKPEKINELKLFVNTIIKASNGANNAPYITNKTNDDTVIGSKETVSQSIDKTVDYEFKTTPHDLDGDKTNVKVTANGTQVMTGSTGYTRNPDVEIPITIPKAVYKDLKVGDQVTVVITAEDSHGATGTETFYLKIGEDANMPPEITNYKSNGTDIIAEGDKVIIPKSDIFKFITIPTDKELGPIDLQIELDNEVIRTEKGVDSGDNISVEIPSAKFASKLPGNTLKVTVKATDDKGSSSTKGFILKIGQIDPVILHRVIKGNVPKDGEQDFTGIGEASFVGDISSLFNTSATITLKVDEKLIIKGDVSIERVDKYGKTMAGKSWKMTKDANGLYTYILNANDIGKVEVDGIYMQVKYNAIIKTLKMTDKVLYNNELSTESRIKIVTIYNKITAPDLF